MTYFLHLGLFASDPVRIVYRVPETVCPVTGYPLVEVLYALPETFTDIALADRVCACLNRLVSAGEPVV